MNHDADSAELIWKQQKILIQEKPGENQCKAKIFLISVALLMKLNLWRKETKETQFF